LASTGHQLLALDYSQIELRIAAILSREDSLIDIFKSGKDVHTAVAAEVFGVSLEAVTKEMRRQAKVINFGILYGMGVNALQVNLNTDRKTAQQFLNAYFANFPKLSEYLDQSKLRTEQFEVTSGTLEVTKDEVYVLL
jgi:DNA polymerase-1